MTTKIQWANETWNPIVGCSPISSGCTNCYAREAANSARLQQFAQYKEVKDWDGSVHFVESALLNPLSWRSPKNIFVCSMSDLFHKNVPDEWRDRIFAIMALCGQHTFQVLTKRPDNMLRYFGDRNRARWITDAALDIIRDEKDPLKWKYGVEQFKVQIPLNNVWVGTSVENQKAAGDRIPLLLRTPAKIRFLSCEPLLEKVELKPEWFGKWTPPGESSYAGRWDSQELHWVIVGGESGTKARMCRQGWIKSLVRQCQVAGVPVFVKQYGTNCYGDDGNKIKFRDRKGGNPDEWPEAFPREMPFLTPVQ